MPAPDLSLNDMPWLTQHPTAGQSLAQGAAVGSVIAQTSLSRKRIEQDQQRIDMDLEILPYKIAEAKQTQDAKHLALQSQWDQRRIMLGNAKAAAEASSTVADSLANGDPDGARLALLSAGEKFGFFASSPQFKTLEGMIDKSEALGDRFQMAQDAVTARKETASAHNETLKALAGMNIEGRQKVAETGAEAKLKGIEMTVKGREDVAKLHATQMEAAKTYAKQSEFKQLQDLHAAVLNAKTDEEFQAANTDYNLFLSLVQKADKEVSESAFIRSELPRIIQSMENESGDPYADKTADQKWNIALVTAKALYRKISKKTPPAKFTPPAASGSSTNAPFRYDQSTGKTIPQ